MKNAANSVDKPDEDSAAAEVIAARAELKWGALWACISSSFCYEPINMLSIHFHFLVLSLTTQPHATGGKGTRGASFCTAEF
jgi:hypothetical protein